MKIGQNHLTHRVQTRVQNLQVLTGTESTTAFHALPRSLTEMGENRSPSSALPNSYKPNEEIYLCEYEDYETDISPIVQFIEGYRKTI